MISKPPPRLLQKSPCVCPSCACCMRLSGLVTQKRNITQGYLQKTLEAKLEWARQSTEIKAGRKESMLSMLEKRGYVNQIVGSRDDLERLMTEKRIGIYCGVDPTASSMHVGHLLPLMVLYWSYIKGFHACSLVGTLLISCTSCEDLQCAAWRCDCTDRGSNRANHNSGHPAFLGAKSQYDENTSAAKGNVATHRRPCQRIRISVGMGMEKGVDQQ